MTPVIIPAAPGYRIVQGWPSKGTPRITLPIIAWSLRSDGPDAGYWADPITPQGEIDRYNPDHEHWDFSAICLPDGSVWTLDDDHYDSIDNWFVNSVIRRAMRATSGT